MAGKGTVTEDGSCQLAGDAEDARWMWALLRHSRELPWGSYIDLAYCRGVVRGAFGEASGGRPMREVKFDWEELGVVAVNHPAML
jgi:hypothetical protein